MVNELMNVNEQEATNIRIGEFKVIRSPKETVWSILGSCISVIFYVRKDLALICHAQLPKNKKYGVLCSDTCPLPCFQNAFDGSRYKYVSCVLEYMVAYLKRKKINLHKVHTTIIGGAAALNLKSSEMRIGASNIATAEEILFKYNMKINRELTGGNEGITFWYHVMGNKLVYKRHKTTTLIELKNNR